MQNEQLRKAGLKITLPRVKILALLERSDKRHVSAEDVYKMLLENGEEIGLATVYRVLTQFESAGLVCRHNFEGGQSILALYGFRTANDHRRVPPDVLECGGHFPPLFTGTDSARHKPGVGQVAPSCRRFGCGEVSVPGQGVVARGKRRRRGAGGTLSARIPGQRR